MADAVTIIGAGVGALWVASMAWVHHVARRNAPGHRLDWFDWSLIAFGPISAVTLIISMLTDASE
jgi:hypothetical protein